jgi:hypothetical protein
MERKGLAVFVLTLALGACSAANETQKSGAQPSLFAGGGALVGNAGVPGFGAAGTGAFGGLGPSSAVPGAAGARAAAGAPSIPGGLPPGGGLPPVSGGLAGSPSAPTGMAGRGAITPPPPVTGAAGGPAMPTMPTTPATPTPAGNMDPVIPMLTAECPAFRNGTISFMGLGGIEIVAGSKPASPTAPMLFYWHGTGSFSGEYAAMAGAVQQGIVSEGGVLVSFQDTTGGDLLSGTAIFGAGDFKLADQLLACAVKNQNIDPRRIFATGCSAGGLFSGAMAAQRSSYMAAAATNSGGWTTPLQFENKHIPALMTIHGAPGVDVVIIDFSQSSATADMAFKKAGGFVINCNHGGGHCGGGGLAGDIWKFFKAHPFGVTPEPWTMLPAGFSPQCMIF